MKLNAKLVLMSRTALLLSANAHALRKEDPKKKSTPPKENAATSLVQQPALPKVCDVVCKTPPGGNPQFVCHCDKVP